MKTIKVNCPNPNHHSSFEALPSEITTDILSRLPSKPLHLSKCVCKAWYSLINSPNFVEYFNNHSSTHNHRMLIFDANSISCVSLEPPVLNIDDTLHDVHDYSFVGTCNGIVCITYLTPIWDQYILLYNPFTHYSTRILPLPDIHLFGFGYDDLSNTYKIMAICDSTLRPQSITDTVKIFNLSSNSWRTLEYFPYCICHCDCVFLNGALHWFVDSGPGVHPDSSALMAFDLRYETFSLVPLPDKFHAGLEWCYFDFDAFEGYLSFHVKDFGNAMKHCMDLWVMNESGVKESWTKLFRVPYMSLNSPARSMKALAYSKSRGRVLLQQGNNFFWCDVEGEMNTVDFVFPLGLKSPRRSALVCLGTLVRPAIGEEQLRNKIDS